MPIFRKLPREEEIEELKKALREKRYLLSRTLKWMEEEKRESKFFLSAIHETDARYYARQIQKIIRRLEALGFNTKKPLEGD